MARVLGVAVSRSTVLRRAEALPDPEVAAPRVVGADEYATRTGRFYGTVLVDVETRRPVDTLPDREASSLAAWLAERPGIEVVCRDRAPFYAEGATAGAPQAIQAAGRWHLWHNLSEAAGRCVAQHRGCLGALAREPAESAVAAPPPELMTGSSWPTGHRSADRIRDRHAIVHTLLAAGHSRRSTGRQLHMTHRTVKRLADAVAPEDLFQGQWQTDPRSSTSTSPTWTTARTRAAPIPGHWGGRACRSATRAATSEFAPTCGRNASHLDRFPPGRRPRGRPRVDFAAP